MINPRFAATRPNDQQSAICPPLGVVHAGDAVIAVDVLNAMADLCELVDVIDAVDALLLLGDEDCIEWFLVRFKSEVVKFSGTRPRSVARTSKDGSIWG
jgi:hypothetical protein